MLIILFVLGGEKHPLQLLIYSLMDFEKFEIPYNQH